MATVQPTLAFDTLAYARTLIADGIERGQAEVLASAMRNCVIANLATNDFVLAVVQEAKTEINHQINEVKAEFKQEITELRHEIKNVETKLNHEIEKVYLAIKESNQSLKIWMSSLMFLMTGALATLMKLLG